MASVFTKIINGEIPSYKIAENAHCYAFLDINPLVGGHTLVIPKKEVDDLFDLDHDTYSELMQFTKTLARAIRKVSPCEKVGMAVIGLEVRHAHIHLVPINGVYDIDFKKEKLQLTPAEFEGIAEKIRQAL